MNAIKYKLLENLKQYRVLLISIFIFSALLSIFTEFGSSFILENFIFTYYINFYILFLMGKNFYYSFIGDSKYLEGLLPIDKKESYQGTFLGQGITLFLFHIPFQLSTIGILFIQYFKIPKSVSLFLGPERDELRTLLSMLYYSLLQIPVSITYTAASLVIMYSVIEILMRKKEKFTFLTIFLLCWVITTGIIPNQLYLHFQINPWEIPINQQLLINGFQILVFSLLFFLLRRRLFRKLELEDLK